MLPALDARGNLPPGIHEATWETVVARFGTSPERRLLLVQLRAALDALAASGCRVPATSRIRAKSAQQTGHAARR